MRSMKRIATGFGLLAACAAILGFALATVSGISAAVEWIFTGKSTVSAGWLTWGFSVCLCILIWICYVLGRAWQDSWQQSTEKVDQVAEPK